jgi:mRNA-degrading endonuclease YafQ of YafQ-DinJ toxin-antitoxin module
MKVIYTDPFRRDYSRLQADIQNALDKALLFLFKNPRHPSLRAKKLPGTSIWYARITRAYRFTFQYSDSLIILRRAGTHDMLTKERKKC